MHRTEGRPFNSTGHVIRVTFMVATGALTLISEYIDVSMSHMIMFYVSRNSRKRPHISVPALYISEYIDVSMSHMIMFYVSSNSRKCPL